MGQAVFMLLIVAVLVAVAVLGKKRDKARADRMESEGKLSDRSEKDSATVPEKKATSGCAWAGLIFVVLCFVVCVAAPDRTSTPRRSSYQRHASTTPARVDNSFEVEYRVTSNGGIGSITYSNESGGTSQNSSTNSPWTHKFRAEPGHFCYVSAQNTSSGGTMRVEIRIDGVVVEQSESVGPHVIATASGYY